jgi:type IV pilus assembly protein PilM
MFLHNPITGAFGLDIGDRSIKLVQLQHHQISFRQGSFGIKEVRELTLPPGYIVDGEIVQPEMVRKKLSLILGKEGPFPSIGSPWLIADLPEPKTFLKLVELSVPGVEVTTEDVLFQAKKHLFFEPEEACIDWQVVSENSKGKRSKVLVGAVQKTIADSYTYLLESLGLKPLALEIQAIALCRSMVTAVKDYEGEARAILDLGATRSNLVVWDHGTPQFSTSLPFSSEGMRDAIAKELKIDPEAAEKMKNEIGITYDKKNPKYLKIISLLTENMITEIRRGLTFYGEHFEDANPITHITICGGLARLKNLEATLARELKITAALGHPWKNIFDEQVEKYDGDDGLSFATAIGLALRAAQNPLEEY